jgi:hypothetical protein
MCFALVRSSNLCMSPSNILAPPQTHPISERPRALFLPKFTARALAPLLTARTESVTINRTIRLHPELHGSQRHWQSFSTTTKMILLEQFRETKS